MSEKYYVVVFESKYVSSVRRPGLCLTRGGEEFILTLDSCSNTIAAAFYGKQIPTDPRLFASAALAKEAFVDFLADYSAANTPPSRHKLSYDPNGKYRLLIVEPVYKQVISGYNLVGEKHV